MSKKRRRARLRLAAAASVAVLVTVLSGYLLWTGPYARSVARDQAAAELLRLERCTFGEAGLSPSEGVRRVRGAALTVAMEQDDAQTWPARCDEAASSLAAALAESGDDPPIALLRELTAGARFLGEGAAARLMTDDAVVYTELEAWIRAARASTLPATDATAVEGPESPPPPAPQTPVRAEALLALPTGALRLEMGPPASMVFSTDGEAVGCATTDDPDVDLRCGAPFTGLAAPALIRPVPRAPGAPLLVLDTRAAAATRESLRAAADGRPLGPALRPAFVRADGGMYGLRFQDSGKPLLAVRRTAAGVEGTAELGAPFLGAVPFDAMLTATFAAIRWEEPGQRSSVQLHAVDGEGALSEPRPLEAGPLRRVCALDGGAWMVASEVVEGTLALDFVPPSGAVTRHEIEVRGPLSALRCVGDAVSFVSPIPAGAGPASVVVTRCRSAGCQTHQGNASPLFGRAETLALDLGDSVLVVQVAPGQPTVTRFAPPAALEQARPRVVLDAPAHGGMDLESPVLIPHRDGALLLFESDGASRAIVIEAGQTHARAAAIEAAAPAPQPPR